MVFTYEFDKTDDTILVRATGSGEAIIPEKCTVIGSQAFCQCIGLTSVKFNKNLTTIGQQAFQNCAKLTSIIFNEKLNIIGSDTFRDCKGLISIKFNENLTEIRSGAFAACPNIKNINASKRFNHLLLDQEMLLIYTSSKILNIGFDRCFYDKKN